MTLSDIMVKAGNGKVRGQNIKPPPPNCMLSASFACVKLLLVVDNNVTFCTHVCNFTLNIFLVIHFKKEIASLP